MSSRFRSDGRSNLFYGYDAARKSTSQSPRPGSRPRSGFGYGLNPATDPVSEEFGNGGAAPTFGAYPAANGSAGIGQGQFRPATPNKKGQYSDAVLNELESQNDEQLGAMSAKVKMLKDITSAIGDEIRDSTAFAEKMNEGFEGTRLRLQGTMRRMLRMAERTGVGWKVWVGFFAALTLLFWYVWIF